MSRAVVRSVVDKKGGIGASFVGNLSASLRRQNRNGATWFAGRRIFFLKVECTRFASANRGSGSGVGRGIGAFSNSDGFFFCF